MQGRNTAIQIESKEFIPPCCDKLIVIYTLTSSTIILITFNNAYYTFRTTHLSSSMNELNLNQLIPL